MNATLPLPPSPVGPTSRDHDVVVRLRLSQIFRDYQDAFQTATGLPLILRATGSFDAPMMGAKNLNPFCALMAAKSKSCSSCLQLQQRVETEAIAGPKTLECFAGLNDSAVPVRLGEKVVGYLQTGQVFFRDATEKQFRAALKQIQQMNPEADATALHGAFFKTRVLTRSHYDAMLQLLASFAQHLSLVANELMIRQTSSEPLAVAKARNFIAGHLGEELSLDAVARAASMSAFYFCKIFKAATGVTFTDYVSRARVEKTKQLLLNPNTRVSEAAYEAGFQSLSQFNRVFRRIEGKAPSAHREDLHGSGPARLISRPALPFAA